MASVEEKFEEVQEQNTEGVPGIPARELPRTPEMPSVSEDKKKAWREEFKKNIADFVDRGDKEGLAVFVERMVHLDTQTEVLNRAGFVAKAEPLMDDIAKLEEGKDRRTGEYVSFNVLFIDLDHFKNINDTYGHAAGDAALVRMTEILRETLRDDDIIGRWSGDEFVVAFTCSSKNNLISRNRFIVAEKVRRALEKTQFEFKGQNISLKASIGVAQRKEGEELLSKVVDRADEAMYVAKRHRNKVAIAEEEGILPPF